jgi:hypothetical protein
MFIRMRQHDQYPQHIGRYNRCRWRMRLMVLPVFPSLLTGLLIPLPLFVRLKTDNAYMFPILIGVEILPALPARSVV